MNTVLSPDVTSLLWVLIGPITHHTSHHTCLDITSYHAANSPVLAGNNHHEWSWGVKPFRVAFMHCGTKTVHFNVIPLTPYCITRDSNIIQQHWEEGGVDVSSPETSSTLQPSTPLSHNRPSAWTNTHEQLLSPPEIKELMLLLLTRRSSFWLILNSHRTK